MININSIIEDDIEEKYFYFLEDQALNNFSEKDNFLAFIKKLQYKHSYEHKCNYKDYEMPYHREMLNSIFNYECKRKISLLKFKYILVFLQYGCIYYNIKKEKFKEIIYKFCLIRKTIEEELFQQLKEKIDTSELYQAKKLITNELIGHILIMQNQINLFRIQEQKKIDRIKKCKEKIISIGEITHCNLFFDPLQGQSTTQKINEDIAALNLAIQDIVNKHNMLAKKMKESFEEKRKLFQYIQQFQLNTTREFEQDIFAKQIFCIVDKLQIAEKNFISIMNNLNNFEENPEAYLEQKI